MLIHWPEILEMGYPEIDDDHRELIKQSNELTKLINLQSPWPDIFLALSILAEEFARHFRTEEEVLKRTGFPRTDAHALQHRRLEKSLTELIALAGAVDGSQPEHRDMLKSLREAFLDMLFRHDLDYKSHLEHFAGR
jgi:hemerythrin